MDEIQLQFKVNATIRSSIISVPNTYKELEDEIRKQVKRLNIIEFGMTYENHDGEHVVLNKDPRCLRIAIASSPVIPGTDLKRLKVEIFEGSSPSVRIKDKTHDDEEKTACSNSSVSHPAYDKSPLKKVYVQQVTINVVLSSSPPHFVENLCSFQVKPKAILFNVALYQQLSGVSLMTTMKTKPQKIHLIKSKPPFKDMLIKPKNKYASRKIVFGNFKIN